MAKKKAVKPKENAQPEDVFFADGKDRTLASIGKLEKLINMGIQNPYGTLNKEIFADKIDNMLTGELQDLAKRVGVIPQNRRDKLIEQLNKNFNEFVSKHSVGFASQRRGGMDPSHKNYAEAMKRLLIERNNQYVKVRVLHECLIFKATLN
jgi:Rps23 Pro-64 3,4-dihydroxylase Tpa1-like proline 4-hydroxylase